MDDKQNNDGALRELALFAGAGGGTLGGHLLGWRTICAVEWEAYPASVLVARQNDGILPPFPIWDDVQTFDGKPWQGRVDVISGGFPCQDISCAGKGAGIDGERSSMWGHMARIIGEVRPGRVLVENSPMLVGRGLARVLGDLAEMGYDAEWCVLGAVDAGAPHKRDRIWLMAYSKGERVTGVNGDDQRKEREARECDRKLNSGSQSGGNAGDSDSDSQSTIAIDDEAPGVQGMGNTIGEGLEGLPGYVEDGNKPRRIRKDKAGSISQASLSQGGIWWATEPDVGRVAHGVAARVDRLKAIGNGQVPAVAALAWNILNQ